MRKKIVQASYLDQQIKNIFAAKIAFTADRNDLETRDNSIKTIRISLSCCVQTSAANCQNLNGHARMTTRSLHPTEVCTWCGGFGACAVVPRARHVPRPYVCRVSAFDVRRVQRLNASHRFSTEDEGDLRLTLTTCHAPTFVLHVESSQRATFAAFPRTSRPSFERCVASYVGFRSVQSSSRSRCWSPTSPTITWFVLNTTTCATPGGAPGDAANRDATLKRFSLG